MTIRMRKRFFEASGLTIEQAEEFGTLLAETQRDVMWQIADLARYSEARWPEQHFQIWPEWVSPGMIQRAMGVGKAYPKEEDREHECTYTQYMQVARKPDRQELLSEMVGQTSDESRQSTPTSNTDRERWLLAVDSNYWLAVTYHAGAGVAAASELSDTMTRMVGRLKERGLTDCVFCFDSRSNFRKELTKDWETPYKSRPSKDREWMAQLPILEGHLRDAGYLCASVDGFEADDLLASYAAKFDGKVTLWARDKDMRQTLSERVNMLVKSEWTQDPTSGEFKWHGEWITAAQHLDETGVRPDQWTDWQSIAGDPTDSISGAEGIGKVGATDMIKEFGSVEAVIQAARDDDPRITAKKRDALIRLDSQLDVVKQLVTLRTDVPIPGNTRLA